MFAHEAMLLRHACVIFDVWAFLDHHYTLLARELTCRRNDTDMNTWWYLISSVWPRLHTRLQALAGVTL